MPTAKVNGVNISYKVEGQGEPLVMIMGYSANRSAWMFQILAFKKQYQVITFDNRGVGKSDKLKGPYSTKMMAEDVIGLMRPPGHPESAYSGRVHGRNDRPGNRHKPPRNE